MSIRTVSLVDKIIQNVDQSLRAVTGSLTQSGRETPAKGLQETALTTSEKKHAASLMRINHTGEVCAQALYLGQATIAKSEVIRQELQHCAEEEVDHLHWCQQRVTELNSHVSYLNPFWFGGSFMLGVVAGLAGDKWNLGFLAETEYQVGSHLESHLDKLPSADKKSRRVVEQMHKDELQHAKTAEKHGAENLPGPVKGLMKLMSKIMTTTVYRL